MQHRLCIEATELSAFIHNALYTSIDENGFLCLHRFTENQLLQYRAHAQVNPASRLIDRTRASASIMLEMITDSDFLGIQYRIAEANCGPDCSDLDLVVDGVITEHFPIKNLVLKTTRSSCFALPEGEHKVQLVLPWGTEFRLEKVVLSGNARFQPIQKAHRAIAFGDSITQGYVSQHPALTYPAFVSLNLDVELVNQGIGGYWFEENSLDEKLAYFQPELLIIAYGTNDFNHKSLDALRNSTEAYVRRLVRIFPEVPILAVMPIYRGGSDFFQLQKLKEYTCDEGKNVLRQVYASCPNITVLEDTFFPRTAEFFREDYLHPNDLGYSIYGKTMVEAITRIYGW